MEPLFIGLDAGTSETKAALFDARFRQLAEARERTRVLRPEPGAAEGDPAAARHAALAVLARIAEAAGPDRGRIAGLGLTAAMVGGWVVDSHGRALRPGIFWEDSRSETVLADLRAAHPDFDGRIFRTSGSVLQQGCTLPVLAWLARHEPQTLARAAHVIGLKDYLRLCLAGRAATDITEAAVAPGDAAARGRSEAMIDLFGLRRHRHLLPEPVAPEALAGGLLRDVAEATGLPEGLPVAIGAGDVPASVIGAGAIDGGAVTIVLGTTCLVGRVHRAPVFEPPDLGLLFTLPGERWFRAMVNVAGTLNLDWALATLAPDLAGDFSAAEAEAAATPPGADGVTYLPYLSESGIIAPVVDAGARGGFSGLAPRHGRGHLLRAVYESVAHAIRDCVDLLGSSTEPVRLIGGGARSDFWTAVIADTLERPVDRPEGSQFGARGAAMLAAVASGHSRSLAEVSGNADQGSRRTMPSGRSRAGNRLLWTSHRDRMLSRGK